MRIFTDVIRKIRLSKTSSDYSLLPIRFRNISLEYNSVKAVFVGVRSYGYISEFLLNGWMEYHNYKIKPLPYLLTVNGRCQIGDLGWSYADNYE